MGKTRESRTVSVSIDRAAAEVYAFLSQPENFPQWASGLCRSIRPDGDAWLVDTPHGPMRVRFTASNAFGVLDHYVYPAPEEEIYVPMRVLANGEGSEVLLTLFRPADMSAERFAEDLGWVERDLRELKALLER